MSNSSYGSWSMASADVSGTPSEANVKNAGSTKSSGSNGPYSAGRTVSLSSVARS